MVSLPLSLWNYIAVIKVQIHFGPLFSKRPESTYTLRQGYKI